MDRRRFLRVTAGAVALGASHPWRLASASAAASVLPPTGAGAPFDHVVLLMMENRSFDHLLGWLPGANGRQAGLSYVDTAGASQPTHELRPDFQGCAFGDPSHSFAGGLTQLAAGRGDGFLLTARPGDTFPIGFYGADARPVLGSLARSYTVCDSYFAAVLGPTFPNRIYQQAGRTDRDRNTFDQCLLPTIWDRLAAAGIEGREYYHDLPTLGLWGQKYQPLMRPFSAFTTDVANGDLAAYTMLDPSSLGAGQGVSNDDHPHADMRAGDELISTIYHALRNSSKWDRTVFIINYDEWGGFYDHVIPPAAAADDSLVPGSTFDFHLRGFRVPCIVMSPFAPARVATAGPFDHTSVLKLVEWRWGLEPLAARDAAAKNLAEVLDLTTRRTDSPDIPVLTGQPRAAWAAPPPAAPATPSATGPPSTPPLATTPTAPPLPPGSRLEPSSPDLPLLPVLPVGAGVLLGAWGLYHLKRTGEKGPLPLNAAVSEEGDETGAA
jgi:phospholipase C